MKNLVTIIIVTYNSARSIEKCIASVLAQSYESIEVIVCDDFSTDNTVEILSGISDPRITLIVGKNNLGPNGNTNRGLSVATGEFVCIAGGDDIFFPDKISRQLELFKLDSAVNLVCNGLSSSEYAELDQRRHGEVRFFNWTEILDIPFHTVGAMVRWEKEKPALTHERFTYNDNMFYIEFIGRKGGKVAIISDELSQYERRASGLNANGPGDYRKLGKIQWEIILSFTVLKIYALFPAPKVIRFYLKFCGLLILTNLRRFCAFSLTKLGVSL